MVVAKEAKGTNDSLGTGRRKTAVARVRIRQGSGKILVNQRALDDYFPTEKDRRNVLAPLNKTVASVEAVDISIRVHGGGIAAQSKAACMLGIARALKTLRPAKPKRSCGRTAC